MKYKCAICSKEFDSIMDRATCELACAKKAAEEAKRAEEELKKKEQAKRKEEVDAAFAHANELLEKYIADYGSYKHVPGLGIKNLDVENFDLEDVFKYFIF